MRKIMLAAPVALALATVIGLAGHSTPAPVQPHVVSEAAAEMTVRPYVAAHVIEPVFGHVLTGSMDGHVAFCGEVSGQNAFGGHTPLQAFVSIPSQDVLVIQQPGESNEALINLWEAACPH